MSRTADGYELQNSATRVVIDGTTGDVVRWQPLGSGNLATATRGVYTAVAGQPVVPPSGYVEKRDDQTWQFYGTDANGITWRKVYNLDHASLLVSFVVQNTAATTRPVQVQLCGPIVGPAVEHTAEQYTAGPVNVHGWNALHGPAVPPSPVWVQSDVFRLKPAERQGYTTEWRLMPHGMN